MQTASFSKGLVRIAFLFSLLIGERDHLAQSSATLQGTVTDAKARWFKRHYAARNQATTIERTVKRMPQAIINWQPCQPASHR